MIIVECVLGFVNSPAGNSNKLESRSGSERSSLLSRDAQRDSLAGSSSGLTLGPGSEQTIRPHDKRSPDNSSGNTHKNVLWMKKLTAAAKLLLDMTQKLQSKIFLSFKFLTLGSKLTKVVKVL